MSEFLAMGGYAWYVWMSYGAVALMVVAEIVSVRARRRKALAMLHARPPEAPAPRARLDPARSA